MVEQHSGIVRITANRPQRLVELMADAGGHGPQRRQLAGFHYLILRMQQLALCLFAVVHFLLQAGVGFLQLPGALQHTNLKLPLGPGLQFDALQVVAAADVQQHQEQEQGKQRRPANQQHIAHRAIDQRARAIDAYRPTGFRKLATLTDPVFLVDPQRLRMHHGVGNVLCNFPLLRWR
ncbi:hypothetical protein D9M71_307830 [compost metagenome]